MSGAIIIRRCASAEEAAILCALLNDAGISASLENWHHAMIDWGVLPALGGVGVLVPSGDAEAGRAAIIAYAESAEERLRADFPDLDAVPLRPKRYRQAVLLAYYTGALLIPLVMALMLIEIVSRVQLASGAGGFDWPIFLTELSRANWQHLILWLAGAAISFLVPLAVFVFLAGRFLARRAELKVAA